MIPLSRRRFLATSMTAAVASSFAPFSRADPDATQLRATRRVIEVNGKAANVFGLLQPDGRHGIVAAAGQRFHVKLLNELDEHTLVHWHGLTPPSEQDGVPGLSQPALPGGGDYEYDFVLARPGTNWMHSHVGLQEQQLLAAPLVVRDPAEAGRDEQEVVILLHDFTAAGSRSPSRSAPTSACSCRPARAPIPSWRCARAIRRAPASSWRPQGRPSRARPIGRRRRSPRSIWNSSGASWR